MEYIRNICLMASPKVSWQQRRYLGQWNMRLLPDGEIHVKKSQHQRSLFYDVCLGIYKHGKFAPYKAKEPNSPSVSDCVSKHITIN